MRREITGRRKERVKDRRDPRFLNVHKKYLRALGKFIRRGRISRIQIDELSSSAHVWKSTFYDHFIHMDDAIEQFWRAMEPELLKLRDEVKEQNKRGGGLSTAQIFSRILVFIYHHRDYYDIIISRENPIALIRMVEIFRPLLTHKWPRYSDKKVGRCFLIFGWEYSGIVSFWGKHDRFDFDKIQSLSAELARLCDSALQRF